MSTRFAPWARPLSALLLAAAAPLAAAAGFPERPVTLVVPYPPGGTADIMARVLSERLGEALGQPVVVENRAGAGTAIASRYVAGAANNGYVLLLGTSTSNAINPALQPDIGYDPIADFTPIAAVAEVPFVLVSHPNTGLNDLAGLVERAKAQPHSLNYASAGVGSSNHLAGELLSRAADIDAVHIPYKGSAPALNDVLAGQVEFMFDLVTTSAPHLSGGRLTPVAVTSPQRHPNLPDVPTVAEAGYPAVEITSWFGLFAPANLPDDVRATLEQATATALARPETQAQLQQIGTTPLTLRGDAFGAYVQDEYTRYDELIRAAGITPE